MADETIVETIANFSRRAFVATAAGLGRLAIAPRRPASAAIVRTDFSKFPIYGNGTLPAGVRSRHIPNVNGMTVHILGGRL